jgi:hypothetical protein
MSHQPLTHCDHCHRWTWGPCDHQPLPPDPPYAWLEYLHYHDLAELEHDQRLYEYEEQRCQALNWD